MNRLVNTEMLVLARESRGLTQGELAQAASLSQADVSRYENGNRPIGQDALQRIADALHYPSEFFYRQGYRHGLGSNGLFHRKQKTLPVKTLDMFNAKVNIFRDIVLQLLRDVDIEHMQTFPQIDVDELRQDVEYIAEMVRAAWKLPPGPINDLIGTIENAGGVAHISSFGTNKIDAVVQWIPPAPPVFLVNQDVPGERVRFTLAHEIGHLVMHDVPTRTNIEEEANAFASALLMPARDIAKDFEQVNLAQLARIKPYWKVSMAALIRRALDIGKINERKARSLYEEMGKMGYRYQEPYPIPLERPTLLKEIIDAHVNVLGYKVSEIAVSLGLYEDDFLANYVPSERVLRILPNNTKRKKTGSG